MIKISLFVTAILTSMYSLYFGANFLSKLSGGNLDFFSALIKLIISLNEGFQVAQVSSILIGFVGIFAILSKKESLGFQIFTIVGSGVACIGAAYTLWTKMQPDGFLVLGTTGPIYIEIIIISCLIVASTLTLKNIKANRPRVT